VKYIAVSAQRHNTAAIRSDGTLAAWGSNFYGQLNMPPPPPGHRYVDVAVAGFHTLGLATNGRIYGRGDNTYGQRDAPPPPPGTSYVRVAAGDQHSMALLSNGQILAWGSNSVGESSVPALPPGLRYTSISASGPTSMARRSDGAVITWGALEALSPALPTAPAGSVIASAQVTGSGVAVFRFEGCTSGASYCSSSTTTNSCAPSISASGLASASASSGFTLQCSSVEGQRAGLFFYGVSGPRDTPFGGGTSRLCVNSPTQRMGVLNSGGTSGACDGAFAQDWRAFVASLPSALGAPFNPGDLVHAQAWFRDPPAPSGSNLSNALSFALCQ
jgi:hypothetical protein